MKRTLLIRVAVFIVLIATFMPHGARSDVLPPQTPDDESVTFALSLEVIGSFERPLTEKVSMSLWAGLGTVWNASDAEQSYGGEVAAELRVYGCDSCYSSSNVGLYLGFGFYDGDNHETRVTITPGMKITLSDQMIRAWFLLEPYVGFSYPIMKDLDGGEWDYANSLFVTFGLRLVFRNLRYWNIGAGRP